MKKLILFLCTVLFFSNCSNEVTNQKPTQANLKTQLESIAKQYGYKLETTKTPINNPNYIINDINELRNKLQLEKESMVIPNYQSIGSQATKQNIFSFESSIEGQLNLMPKNNQNMFNRDGDPTVYTHSNTVYFDNRFPEPNIAVTIWYNVNSSGNITSSTVTSTAYGYGIGTYSQSPNINMYTIANIVVFQVTGQISSSVGIGAFSLNSGQILQFTGNLTFGDGSSGNGSTFASGMVREEHLDQIEPRDH